jgi:hypothetical protein
MIGRLPSTHDGQVWSTRYICDRCGADFLHVEMSPDPSDDPVGLPFEHRWCDCGGFLIARSPDYDSGHG